MYSAKEILEETYCISISMVSENTSHAIMDVMEYVYKSLDENKFLFGVCIDLKKESS